MQASQLSEVQRAGDGIQERNGQVLIPGQFRKVGHRSDRPATRNRGDGRLARPAGPLHHPKGAKGRNFRQRRKPEGGSPVREPSPKLEMLEALDAFMKPKFGPEWWVRTEMERFAPKRKRKP